MLINPNKVLNYQYVSLPANQLQERFYFPDLPNLRDVLTYRIVAYHRLIISKDINNVDIVLPSVLESSYITINCNGMEKFQKLDLIQFVGIATKNAITNFNGYTDLTPIPIDFSKTFVEISGSTPAFPFVFGFGIYYTK